MSNPQEKLNEIMATIFKLKEPPIEETRKQEVFNLIETTVNGDTIKSSLVINAQLNEKSDGAIVYILTNLRIIKIIIVNDPKTIESTSAKLDTIISIDRKIIDGTTAQVGISFQNQNMYVGLRYLANDQMVSKFFREVDESRSPKGAE
jgi:hypothetical protein